MCNVRVTDQNTLPYLDQSTTYFHLYNSVYSVYRHSDNNTYLFFCVLKLEDVIGFCCDFLFSWLDETNILEMHHLADLYGLQQLNAKVHSYILWNVQTLSHADVYRQFPQDEIFRALCSDELQVNSENEVYETALHYHYSPEQVETDQVYLQVSQKVCLYYVSSSPRFKLLLGYHCFSNIPVSFHSA